MCDDHQWEGAKATAQFALAHPVGLVIWNELKHNYPARMIEEVDSYLDGHGVDWTQRQFETMLQGVRNLSGPDA